MIKYLYQPLPLFSCFQNIWEPEFAVGFSPLYKFNTISSATHHVQLNGGNKFRSGLRVAIMIVAKIHATIFNSARHAKKACKLPRMERDLGLPLFKGNPHTLSLAPINGCHQIRQFKPNTAIFKGELYSQIRNVFCMVSSLIQSAQAYHTLFGHSHRFDVRDQNLRRLTSHKF